MQEFFALWFSCLQNFPKLSEKYRSILVFLVVNSVRQGGLLLPFLEKYAGVVLQR